MFLPEEGKGGGIVGFPRIRGDVPQSNGGGAACQAFSPHTRGCSHSFHLGPGQVTVFPAYAGMFRSSFSLLVALFRFPRIRGDVPCWKELIIFVMKFSPHTRGCSFVVILVMRILVVFPAYAGMFRISYI